MVNKTSALLNSTELLDIYGIPTLNDSEIRELFTFNDGSLPKRGAGDITGEKWGRNHF